MITIILTAIMIMTIMVIVIVTTTIKIILILITIITIISIIIMCRRSCQVHGRLCIWSPQNHSSHCREHETKFLVRTLVSNLRVGANWRSVIGAMARAVVLHQEGPRIPKARLDAAATAASEAYHVSNAVLN